MTSLDFLQKIIKPFIKNPITESSKFLQLLMQVFLCGLQYQSLHYLLSLLHEVVISQHNFQYLIHFSSALFHIK